MEFNKKTRAAIKGQLTRMENFVVSPDVSVAEIKVRFERLDNICDSFDKVQQVIEQNAEDLAVEAEERERFEAQFFRTKAVMLEKMEAYSSISEASNSTVVDVSSAIDKLVTCQQAFLNKFSQQTVQTNNSATPASDSNVSQNDNRASPKLPKINIPEFSGEMSEWIRFRDLFKSLINDRTDISNIEKLEYLQGRVQGEALSILKHLSPSNENFDVAWKLLCDRYDDTPAIVNSYLQKIFEAPAMKSGGLSELKQLYNAINEGYNGLKALRQPVEYWDYVLLYHLTKKLDNGAKILWSRENRKGDSGFDKFLQFLKDRIKERERVQIDSREAESVKKTPRKPERSSYASSVSNCIKCDANHLLFQCDQFKALSVPQRKDFVQSVGICANCLRFNHYVKDCKYRNCKKCDAKHNTLLHESMNRSFNLLPTAIVRVRDASGSWQPCRALLDSGSQTTLITESCVQRLRLQRRRSTLSIRGVGNGEIQTTSRGVVQLSISDNNDDNAVITQAFILQKVTSNAPPFRVAKAHAAFFKHLKLADPLFDEPGPIDILLDSNLVFKALIEGTFTSPQGDLIAKNTIFGWVVAGNTTTDVAESHTTILHTSLDDLDHLVKSFWQQEGLLDFDPLNDDDPIERHFTETHRIREDGRFIVSLPFAANAPSLGNSSNTALKRLLSMEKRFQREPDLKKQYIEFLSDYESLGHMTRVPCTNGPSYLLPHHAVIKASSTTTKLRVVFDASAKSSSGASLNDCLLVGPTIQSDLFSVLVRFRKPKIAFSADIAQMFRQILVAEADRCYQQIYWRESENDEVHLYELNTVTYGTGPASFLATRVLRQIALNNMPQYPESSRHLIEQFYMDDYMGGAYTDQEAEKISKGLIYILNAAGMRLRKWVSNCRSFLETIAVDDRELCDERVLTAKGGIKTLGLTWNTSQDVFYFRVSIELIDKKSTKRTILAAVAKIFYPFGWMAPSVIYFKLFLKELWSRGLDWDDPVPADLQIKWNDFVSNAVESDFISIPRWLNFSHGANVELHAFADASRHAFAAVVYSKIVKSDGSIVVSLLASKTRVAPIKSPLTIPRLELCAALLAAQLVKKIIDAWKGDLTDLVCWSDSMAALGWIRSYPKRREIFVDNRVFKIVDLVSSSVWKYVPTDQNPADLATRGISPRKLPKLSLWWQGPQFLHDPETTSFDTLIVEDEESAEKDTTTNVNVVSPAEGSDLYNQKLTTFSNYHRLIRVVSRIKRMFSNRKSTIKQTGPLCLSEIRAATFNVIRLSQESTFAVERELLLKNKPLTKHSKLHSLNVFLDQHGILRLNSRLKNACLPYDQLYPIILHKHDHLVQLIIARVHRENLHSGIRLTIYLVSLKFYVLGLAHAVRRCIFQCPVCMRHRKLPYRQQMGQLPEPRVTPSLPFVHTGVDYCGPFTIRTWKGRGAKSTKGYVALFICLSTKAIHLEPVSELTTQAFIAALRRFVERRGMCRNIYSDNGLNFVGANQYLRSLANWQATTKHREAIQSAATTEFSIEWHFTPPYTPHFGGLWEAGVKSVKRHLYRVMGTSTFTFEELTTALCQIEACVNSRPLCQRFEGDVDPLTPSHFLNFRAIKSVPDEGIQASTLTRWQYVQKIVNEFWRKWSSSYLSELRRRPKWLKPMQNAKPDDLVVVIDDSLPPCKWLLGRILRTYPGDDGLVRAVDVRTVKGEYRRPICKLCPLLIGF